jgi:hypothetical protein
MNPLRRYPVLSTLLRPFRRSPQQTCAALVAALCQTVQASSFAIASQLSCLTEVQFGSALTRLYRFLRNERFDNWLLTEQMLRRPPGRRSPLLLALDWTQWQDRFSVLTAAVCTGTRSIPVAVSACHKPSLARSQNLREETFLRLTVDRLRAAGVEAVWLCERGFHRVNRRGTTLMDDGRTCHAGRGAADAAREQDERGAPLAGPRRLLLLVGGERTAPTYGPIRARTSAATAPSNV